jgi:glycosyltransferase involved in cell wall biosynthesis
MKIGILFPAYNESKNIGNVIKEAKKYFRNSEIVVVDDGSTDNTYSVAKSLGAIVLRHDTNKGKGEALKTGMNFLKNRKIEYVLIADADRQYSLNDAFKILNKLTKGFDVVTGFRLPKEIPYANRMGNFIWRKIFNFLFNTKFYDTNCGFMAFRKSILPKIIKIHGGYIVENSILINCVKNNLKVGQVKVNVRYGKRKISKFARMFFGVLFYIISEGIKYKLKKL